jgi:hypothetical protein
VHSSFYTYKHIVQNLASCVGPLMSIGLFMIMGDVWTVRYTPEPALSGNNSSVPGQASACVCTRSGAGGTLQAGMTLRGCRRRHGSGWSRVFRLGFKAGRKPATASHQPQAQLEKLHAYASHDFAVTCCRR